jgi:hypothetical protein
LHCIAPWAVLPLGGLRRERRSHAAQPTPDSQVYTASLRCSRASTQSPQPHEEEDKCCGLHHHLRHHLEPSCWCGGISSEFIRTPMKTDVALGPGSKKANLCAHLIASVQMAQTPESCNCANGSGTQSNKCQFYSKQVQTTTRVISSRISVQRCGLHPGVCTQRVVGHIYVTSRSVIVQLLSHPTAGDSDFSGNRE